MIFNEAVLFTDLDYSPAESVMRATIGFAFVIVDNAHHHRFRTVRTKHAIASVEQSIEEYTNESIRHRA